MHVYQDAEETFQQGCLGEIYIFRSLSIVDNDNCSRSLVDPDYPTMIDFNFCFTRLTVSGGRDDYYYYPKRRTPGDSRSERGHKTGP